MGAKIEHFLQRTWSSDFRFSTHKHDDELEGHAESAWFPWPLVPLATGCGSADPSPEPGSACCPASSQRRWDCDRTMVKRKKFIKVKTSELSSTMNAN